MVASPETDTVRLDLTLYFQRNPFARETALSLSQRVGRPLHLVEQALERLFEQTIVEQRRTGAGALYRYRRPYLNQGAD